MRRVAVVHACTRLYADIRSRPPTPPSRVDRTRMHGWHASNRLGRGIEYAHGARTQKLYMYQVTAGVVQVKPLRPPRTQRTKTHPYVMTEINE